MICYDSMKHRFGAKIHHFAKTKIWFGQEYTNQIMTIAQKKKKDMDKDTPNK